MGWITEKTTALAEMRRPEVTAFPIALDGGTSVQHTAPPSALNVLQYS